MHLKVVTYGKPHGLPLRTINRLTEGDTIRYSPILRDNERRSGEVALVLAPTVPESKSEAVVVLDPRPANKPTEWKIPRKISVVAFVYGPDGLNRGKVQHMLAKNTELVEQLADYAQKTSQTEALIQTLTSTDSSAAATSAALQGFASQYGLAVKIDKTQPADEQAMTLLRTVNPALQGSDPLAPMTSQRVGETASIATSIAGLFFGSPVGLAAGGTAMVMDLRENHHIFCSIVVYPVIPKGHIIYRLVSTSVHTDEDIERTLVAFRATKKKLDAGDYKVAAIPDMAEA